MHCTNSRPPKDQSPSVSQKFRIKTSYFPVISNGTLNENISLSEGY